MPLTFKGSAIADPAGRAIRFAGYPSGRHHNMLIICEVTVEAVKAMARDNESFDLEAAFTSHATLIFDIASAKYDAGEVRPRVTTEDIWAVLKRSGHWLDRGRMTDCDPKQTSPPLA